MTAPDEDVLENEEDDDDDDDDDDDEDTDEDTEAEGGGDDDDDDEDDDAESDDYTPEDIAELIAKALRDGMEGHASASEDRNKIYLHMEDDSKWLVTVKKR